jgi:hypothetical protein
VDPAAAEQRALLFLADEAGEADAIGDARTRRALADSASVAAPGDDELGRVPPRSRAAPRPEDQVHPLVPLEPPEVEHGRLSNRGTAGSGAKKSRSTPFSNDADRVAVEAARDQVQRRAGGHRLDGHAAIRRRPSGRSSSHVAAATAGRLLERRRSEQVVHQQHDGAPIQSGVKSGTLFRSSITTSKDRAARGGAGSRPRR